MLPCELDPTCELGTPRQTAQVMRGTRTTPVPVTSDDSLVTGSRYRPGGRHDGDAATGSGPSRWDSAEFQVGRDLGPQAQARAASEPEGSRGGASAQTTRALKLDDDDGINCGELTPGLAVYVSAGPNHFPVSDDSGSGPSCSSFTITVTQVSPAPPSGSRHGGTSSPMISSLLRYPLLSSRFL